MNRINIVWEIISQSLPRVKQHANDRIPSIEEIKKLIEYPDRRVMPIVLLSVSTGIRVGAWDYIKWKHINPITDDPITAGNKESKRKRHLILLQPKNRLTEKTHYLPQYDYYSEPHGCR
jgi:hypothetical protein